MIEQIFSVLVMLSMPITVVGLLYMAGREKPLFKKTCDKCGCKDKNWTTVHIGCGDFAWQHNCKEARITEITS